MKYIMFRLATCPAYNEGTLTMYLMYQDSFLGSHDASPRITLPPPSPNSIVLAEATRRPAAMQARTFLPSREPFTFTDEFNRRGSSTLPRSLPPPSSICLKPTIATLKSRVGFSILTPTHLDVVWLFQDFVSRCPCVFVPQDVTPCCCPVRCSFSACFSIFPGIITIQIAFFRWWSGQQMARRLGQEGRDARNR